MTPEMQALRERFRDQMPGMAIFDELATKYEQLLAAQAELEHRWAQTAPEALKALRSQVQALIDSPDASPDLKDQLTTVLKGGLTP